MNFLILGMPNVGKTSLYNIISNSSDNIIHKTLGTTRDWHVSSLKDNININIYDSPGIVKYKNNLIDKKLEQLISNIDIFVYVIDYKIKNYNNDYELFNLIRKFNKEIILIVNKDDNYKQDKDLSLFGVKKIFYISCSHMIGLDKFFEFISKYKVNNNIEKKINFSIGLFGKTNVGKSTLLNKLVGYDRSLVSHKPRTTTDVVSSSFSFQENNYLIKDTAGLIKKNKIDRESLDYYATKKTLSIIRDIDINLLLIDVQQGFDTQSKKIFNLIYQKSNILIFIINKIDLISQNKKKFLSELKNSIELEFSQSKNIFILPISSLNKNDVNKLKKNIHILSYEIKKNISTSQINQWLKSTANSYVHPRIKGKEVKFKYATQISKNPLTIKIFSNFSKEISIHYRRYLLNSFYKFFKIKSKNLKIVFSKSQNPFN